MTIGVTVVYSVTVSVVEMTAVTVFAVGVTLTVVVAVARAAVAVRVCVFVTVVVLHMDTVFAGGAGQTLVHAGQIRLFATPFSHDGGLT